jgi:hypothetical protein
VTPCIEWWNSRLPKGYGKFHIKGQRGWVLAHRAIWEQCFGPIPDGLLVLHQCDNPPCVNPEHLFLGTTADNVADKMAKGRWKGGAKKQERCRNGHALTPENVILGWNGKGHRSRRCRICRNAWRRESQKPVSTVETREETP